MIHIFVENFNRVQDRVIIIEIIRTRVILTESRFYVIFVLNYNVERMENKYIYIYINELFKLSTRQTFATGLRKSHLVEKMYKEK